VSLPIFHLLLDRIHVLVLEVSMYLLRRTDLIILPHVCLAPQHLPANFRPKFHQQPIKCPVQPCLRLILQRSWAKEVALIDSPRLHRIKNKLVTPRLCVHHHPHNRKFFILSLITPFCQCITVVSRSKNACTPTPIYDQNCHSRLKE